MQESHLSMDASGKWVPKAPEVPWKIPDTYEIKTLSCPYTFQQSLYVSHLQAPDCLSFRHGNSAASRSDDAFLVHYNVKPLLLWKHPWPKMWGQQISLKTGSYPGCQNVSQGLGFLLKLFAIFPGLHFATHFFHSFAASYFSLISLVSRNLPCFNFTRILTIEIHPIVCFKVNHNNSSSITSCELLRHLT